MHRDPPFVDVGHVSDLMGPIPRSTRANLTGTFDLSHILANTINAVRPVLFVLTMVTEGLGMQANTPVNEHHTPKPSCIHRYTFVRYGGYFLSPSFFFHQPRPVDYPINAAASAIDASSVLPTARLSATERHILVASAAE